jgi:hypothetical protein
MVSPVNPGKVEWSGENPGIYLKDEQGDWSTLAVFFKVVTSPLGGGAGVLVLGAPSQALAFPAANNVCVTNNQPLMQWLIADFVSRFASFAGAAGALGCLPYLPATSLATTAERGKFHQESVAGKGVEIVMRWEDLAEPFAVDVAPAMSATGRHQMYSVFVEARRGAITMNGTPLPGKVIQRNFLDRRMSTAFLAFSETWITPPR